MKNSVIHHLALTAYDLEKSADFYDAILAPLGYKRHSTNKKLCTWHGAIPEILIYQAKEQGKHLTYTPGIHHIAFQVQKKGVVDAVFQISKEKEARILDEPMEYPHYSEGYYALFFLDPDGIKVEFAYIPNPTS